MNGSSNLFVCARTTLRDLYIHMLCGRGNLTQTNKKYEREKKCVTTDLFYSVMKDGKMIARFIVNNRYDMMNFHQAIYQVLIQC